MSLQIILESIKFPQKNLQSCLRAKKNLPVSLLETTSTLTLLVKYVTTKTKLKARPETCLLHCMLQRRHTAAWTSLRTQTHLKQAPRFKLQTSQARKLPSPPNDTSGRCGTKIVSLGSDRSQWFFLFFFPSLPA